MECLWWPDRPRLNHAKSIRLGQFAGTRISTLRHKVQARTSSDIVSGYSSAGYDIKSGVTTTGQPPVGELTVAMTVEVDFAIA